MKVVRDPALPGLAVALDVERVRELLRRALPECRQDLDLEVLKTYSVHYEPGRRCTLLYSGRFRNSRGGRSVRQLLTAVVLPDGEAPPAPPRPLAATGAIRSGFPVRTPVVWLPGARMTVYPYPLDPCLPSLADACDPAAVRRELSQAWKSRDVRVKRVAVERLGYTPFARAALGYEVLAESRNTGLPETRRLVGKLDAKKPAAALFARSWAVWRAAGERIALVPPAGYLPALGLFLQERVDGVRLNDVAGDARFVKWVRRTARSIAAFHDLELPLCARRSPGREAATVRRWGRALSAIRPASAVRIRKLCTRIAHALEQRATVTGPVHADLHPANLLVRGDRVTLIDIDNAALGDRLLDVGRFLSALRTTAFRLHGRTRGLAEAEQAFLDSYLEITGEQESRARLFEAACLIISAGTGFRLQRDAWQESADMLIDEAERALERSRHAKVEGRRAAGTWVQPGPAVRRAWAEDPVYVKAALDDPVRSRYGAELSRCQVRARRVGVAVQRFRYRVSGRREGEPWQADLEGVLRNRGGGRGAARRVATAASALAAHGVTLIPGPVAFLPELGLHVLELPAGVPLSSLLSAPQGPLAAERLAGCLAALHDTDLELDRRHGVEDVLLALERRVARVERERAGTWQAAREMFERVADRIGGLRERQRPVLRKLAPGKLLCSDAGVAVTEVDDIVLSHPCLDAADFLARLRMIDSRVGSESATALVAERFRARYLELVPGIGPDLEVLEAAVLLGLACVEAGREARPHCDRLLVAAGGLLEGRLPASRAGGVSP